MKHGQCARCVELAAEVASLKRHAQGAPDRGALLELLSNAYNEGFGEGMREHSSSKGGWPWSSRKQKYSALLDKALSAVTSTECGVQSPCSHPKAKVWCYRDDDTYMRCEDCGRRWCESPTAPETHACLPTS